MSISYFNSLLLYFLFVGLVTPGVAQENVAEKRDKVSQFHTALDTYHIYGDSSKSFIPDRLPGMFLRQLETSGRFFTEQHASLLHKTLKPFHERPISASLQFLDSAYQIYTAQLARRLAFLDSLDAMDFSANDTLIFQVNIKVPQFHPNQEELNNSWLKMMKFNVLSEMVFDSSNADYSEPHLNAVLQSMIEIERCSIQNLMNPEGGIQNVLLEKYFKAYAQCYDPHSDYFSIQDEKLFQNDLSDKMYSCGLMFERGFSGELMVTALLSGSSASKTDMKPGDEVIHLKTPFVDNHPACLSDEEIYSCFFSEKAGVVEVKVKSRSSNQVNTYVLQKEISNNVFNEIFSSSVDGSNYPLGYIHFPSFYINSTDSERGVAEELAKSILKLKLKKIKGLVLDLRDNGGGAIDEGVDLSGFFMDYGPLFQTVSSFYQKPIVNTDLNRGTLYADQLLILTNAHSASASEMFLTAMKANGRVLHVGSTTFGKASGQSMLPLSIHEYVEPFGYLKVTSLRVFDLDGSTYQSKGIEPDIALPDAIPDHLATEMASLYAFKNESIAPQKVKIKGSKWSIPLDSLMGRHTKRLANDSVMSYLWYLNDSINQLGKKPINIPLNMDAVKRTFKEVDTTRIFRMENRYMLKPLKETSLSKEIAQELARDPILIECFDILEDWIGLNQTNQ